MRIDPITRQELLKWQQAAYDAKHSHQKHIEQITWIRLDRKMLVLRGVDDLEVSMPIEVALELLDALQMYKEDLIMRLGEPDAPCAGRLTIPYIWKARLAITNLNFIDGGTSRIHIREEGQKLMFCGQYFKQPRVIPKRMMNCDTVCHHCIKSTRAYGIALYCDTLLDKERGFGIPEKST